MVTIPVRNRRKSTEWAFANPVLRQGDLALETDTGLLKAGDGTTGWNSLPYTGGELAGGTTSTATPSFSANTYSVYAITALATDITSVTISGTPRDGQRIIMPITDNGTSRSIAWGSGFTGKLLLKTAPNVHHFQELVYSSSLGKWVGSYAYEPTALWGPRDTGLLAWAYDPTAATGSSITVLGTLNLVKVKVTPGVPVSNCHIVLATQGSGLTNAFMALYHPTTLAKLGATADLTTAWNTTVGNRTHALASPVTPTTDTVYVGFYSYGSGATAPTFARGANSNGVYLGGSSGNYRFCRADTGLTTALPDPAGAQTPGSISYWVGLS